MKHLLTFFALLASTALFSQNYQAFDDGNEYHYARAVGSRDYLFSVKLNFLEINGADSVFSNYEQVNIWPSELPSISLDGHCVGTDSWIGTQGIKTASGVTDFINEYGAAVVIKTAAVLNESWNFHQYSFDQHFIATVTNVYEADVLGTMDSIKEITLNLFNETNNNIMPHAFNGKKILLSKNKGFVQVYNFYRFPQDTGVFTLVGNETEGRRPLMQQDLYNFEVGDYFVYANNSTKEFRIITSKTVAADSYTYHFKKVIRINNIYAYVADEVKQYDFVPGAYRLMGQFDPAEGDYFNAYNGVTVNYTENNADYIESFYFEDFSNPCWYYNSSYGTERSNLFVEGLGFIRQNMHEWYEDYDEWGNPVSQDFYTQRTLNYYRGNGEYGAYESPYQQLMVESDKTESCDGLISFTLPNAGITSVLWHFGDGEQATTEDALHQYAAQGTYNVSVDIFSDFGDTTLVMADQIVVGSNSSDLVTDPVKILSSNCNEFIFRDNTPMVDSRTWTFPGGETFTDSLVSYTFADTGNYVVHLSNANGYCSDNDSLEIFIRTLESPIASTCPITGPSYSLFGFELDDVAIEGSYYYEVIESPAYDGFMNGCNQFVLEPGQEVNLRLYLGYYELVDVGNGNYDPSYTGYQFDVWIDYNNSGDFDVSENVASSYCFSGLDIGAYNLYGYGLFTVPNEAVRGVPLRMRVGANSEGIPCQGELYDFSVYIPNPLGLDEKQAADKATVFPNPGKGDFVLELNNAQAIANLQLKVLNLSGQEVWQTAHKNLAANASASIDLQHVQNGVYFIEINNDGHKQVIKIIKE